MSNFFPIACSTVTDRVCYTVLLLLAYSFLGWCGEMAYCSIGQRRLCEKRGFLNGPLCPIYGHGAIVVLLALDGGCANPVLTFFLGAILTSIVEYATSYAMEKLFRMRWWDYSRYRFQINGRVCLLNSTLFGLASVFLCHFANPPMAQWLAGLFTAGVGVPLAVVLGGVYAVDIVASVWGAVQIGDRLAKLQEIYAELSEKLEQVKVEQLQSIEAQRQRLEERAERAKEEAQQKLHALYEKQGFFERRLMKSFPTMKSIRHPETLKKWKEYLSHR